jgi:protocatechuate 3,4-dioxygenase beta subunit
MAIDDHGRLSRADLSLPLDRRRVLLMLGGAGLASLIGCGSDSGSKTATPTTGAPDAPSASAGAAGDCTTVPEETAGPFPGDGSNGPDVLTAQGVVRRDITSSFGAGRGKAEGVPLDITLTVVDSARSCRALGGGALYVWHCDREGRYSLYSDGVTDENYLRGVQAVDADGRVTFRSIFPACYPGRWPHIHFTVYESLNDATRGATGMATSQVALPAAWCDRVFATPGYEQSVTCMRQLSLTDDNVFGDDGGVHQLGTVTGSIEGGLTVALTVPVASS